MPSRWTQNWRRCVSNPVDHWLCGSSGQWRLAASDKRFCRIRLLYQQRKRRVSPKLLWLATGLCGLTSRKRACLHGHPPTCTSNQTIADMFVLLLQPAEVLICYCCSIITFLLSLYVCTCPHWRANQRAAFANDSWPFTHTEITSDCRNTIFVKKLNIPKENVFLCSLSKGLNVSACLSVCLFVCLLACLVDWFQASAAKQMTIALSWVIVQPVVASSYRRFGTTYQSHPQDSAFLNPEYGTDRLSGNVGKKLPLLAA